MSWDLLAPSTHIAFDCLIRVYINLTPCSLSSDGDVGWSCRNKQTRGFCLFPFWCLQWKIWSGENCGDALVSGEERFLDLGEMFLPSSLSRGYRSISGLLWLQKVFSFWPFLYSEDSCCCLEESPAACLHRQRVTPSVMPACTQRWGLQGLLWSMVVQGAGMWPGWTKRQWKGESSSFLEHVLL